MKLLIDATRNRSGGIISYVKNFIRNFDFKKTKINEIVICANRNLLNKLHQRNSLIKYNHSFLEKNLIFELIWQLLFLPKLLKKKKINILFSTDASTLCHFSKSIVFNQDLLSFGNNINKENIFIKKIRLYLIKYIQIRALNKSTIAIFSSRHSQKLISRHLNKKKNNTFIYPGIDNKILTTTKKKLYVCSKKFKNKSIKLIYVSPLINYKNHLSVVKAYCYLSKKYKNLEIKFVGSYLNNLNLYNKIINTYPLINENNFTGEINNYKVIDLLYKSDIFIFASDVEAFGMSLAEAMAVGIPIICSNQSSLPEILKTGGIYFNPKKPSQLSNQIDRLIKDYSLRKKLSITARKLAQNYTWQNHMNKFYEVLNKL
tara:strand:- start:10572 stop:11690 length:1119 start_codon:yes stop_codon:yes gene_type:complete